MKEPEDKSEMEQTIRRWYEWGLERLELPHHLGGLEHLAYGAARFGRHSIDDGVRMVMDLWLTGDFDDTPGDIS